VGSKGIEEGRGQEEEGGRRNGLRTHGMKQYKGTQSPNPHQPHGSATKLTSSVVDCIFVHLCCQTRKCRGGLCAEHEAENLQIIWSRDSKNLLIFEKIFRIIRHHPLTAVFHLCEHLPRILLSRPCSSSPTTSPASSRAPPPHPPPLLPPPAPPPHLREHLPRILLPEHLPEHLSRIFFSSPRAPPPHPPLPGHLPEHLPRPSIRKSRRRMVG